MTLLASSGSPLFGPRADILSHDELFVMSCCCRPSSTVGQKTVTSKKGKYNDLEVKLNTSPTTAPNVYVLLNNRSRTSQNVKSLLQQGEPVALQTPFSVEHPWLRGVSTFSVFCFSESQRLAASHAGGSLVNPAHWPLFPGSTYHI